MNKEIQPIPVGTVVTYHGSLSAGTGRRYVVTAHADPFDLFDDEQFDLLDDAYPDGVAYEIWPEGMEHRFGNRAHMVYRVRRGSLKEVES